MKPTFEEQLQSITDRSEEQQQLGLQVLQAGGGALFPLDFLAIAVINRSIANGKSLTHLLQSHNYLCAATIIRLQLDSCLRFYAAFIVDNPHDFANAVLKGASVRDLKDANGKRMTDRYLVNKLGSTYEWMPRVYERSSGFIHLSNKHIFADMQITGEDGRATISIGPGSHDVPAKYYHELAACFVGETDVLLHYVRGWLHTKQSAHANPAPTP